MYEGYPKEIIDKIKELGLYGKDLREIMIISINACTEMKKDSGVNAYNVPDKLRKNIEELQRNQINLLYKIDKLR